MGSGVVLCVMMPILVWWFGCLGLLLWLECYCDCGLGGLFYFGDLVGVFLVWFAG